MKTDILMSGSTVKNHISLKTGFGYNATRTTSFLSWFQAIRLVCAQLLQGDARNVVNGVQKFGVIGFEVANIGGTAINAVDAHCVRL